MRKPRSDNRTDPAPDVAKSCYYNDRENGTVHGGFSFMDDCSGASGQRWRFVKDGSWYRLKSEFQGDGKCLESNDPTHSTPETFGGNDFMDDCAGVGGQMWRLVPD